MRQNRLAHTFDFLKRTKCIKIKDKDKSRKNMRLIILILRNIVEYKKILYKCSICYILYITDRTEGELMNDFKNRF